MRGSAGTQGSQPSSFMAGRSLGKASSLNLQSSSLKKNSSAGSKNSLNKHLMASNLGPKNSVLDVVPEFPEKNNNDKSYLEDDDENDDNIQPVMILYSSCKSSSDVKVNVPNAEGLTKSLIKSSDSKTSK